MRSSSEEEFVVPMRLARTETAAEKRGISETEKVPYMMITRQEEHSCITTHKMAYCEEGNTSIDHGLIGANRCAFACL